jgi:hypothetical protein
VFFVSADSKGVAGEFGVSAHSKGLKVAVFSMSWEWLVSADSKEFMDAFNIPIGIHTGTAHSKGVRRTTRAGIHKRPSTEGSCRLNDTIIAY